jgi:hypothetical protein
MWCHQQESNLYLALRRHSFYPLNYGGGLAGFELYSVKGFEAQLPHSYGTVKIRSIAVCSPAWARTVKRRDSS